MHALWQFGNRCASGGARFVARSALVRASLIAAATLNFFYVMFAALYLLYAVRVLHIRPGLVGVLIGAGAIGAVLGSLVTKHLAALFTKQLGKPVTVVKAA